MSSPSGIVPEQFPAHAAEMSEEEIDLNIEESFPASDPPSWTTGTDRRSHAHHEEEHAGLESERNQSGSAPLSDRRRT